MVIALAAFALYLLALRVALRAWAGTPPAVLGIACALAVYVAVVVAAAIVRPPLVLWDMTVPYAFLVVAFLMLFGAVYKSVSLRLMCELLERPGRGDAYEAILGRYIARDSFGDRAAILVALEWAERHDGRLALTRKGRRIARGMRALQRLFNIEKSG